MRFIKSALLFVFFTISSLQLKAEEGLNVFGFFQGRLQSATLKSDFPGFAPTNSFDIQQLNLMASNNFGNGFSAFVNLEFINTYNTTQKWGSFNIQEAFAKYENENGTFKVKAGLFLPQFNNLLEISNRTPLLPYIYRPLVYETQVGNIIDFSNFLPQQGNFQVYGSLPLTETTKLDYAAFTGNLTNDFIDKTDPVAGTIGASNTVTALSYGGRLGININTADYGSLKFGGSFVLDRQKSRTLNKIGNGFAGLLPLLSSLGVNQDSLVTGNLDRNKIGIDLSYSIYGFTLSGEVIMTSFSDVANLEDKLKAFGDPLKDAKAAASQIPDEAARLQAEGALNSLPPFFKTIRATGDSFNKMFYFATLQYDINDDIFVYGTTGNITDETVLFMANGITNYSFGGGYKVVPQTVLKLQYNNFDIGSDIGAFSSDTFMLAVSVMF